MEQKVILTQTQVSRSRVWLFYTTTAIFWASIYVYVPILSPYAEDKGASLGLIGLVIGSYGFVQLVLRIPTGIWSDRVGSRRPFILVGFVAATIGGLGMALSPNPWFLLFFRGVSGVAATTWVAFTVLFSSYFPPERATHAMSIITFCTSVGQLFATFSGGPIAEVYGRSAPFYVGAILALVGLVLTLGVVEKRKPSRSNSISLGDIISIGRNRELLIVSLIAALGQYATFVTLYGFTPLYAKSLGASDTHLGFLSLVSTLSHTITTLLSGTWMAKRIEEHKVVAAGYAINALAIIAIPFIKSLWLLDLSQGLGGLGRGMTYPILMGLSIKTVPTEKRATAMGFFQAIYSLGMFGGPALSGFLGQGIGLTGVFISTGAVCSLAALLSLTLISTTDRALPAKN